MAERTEHWKSLASLLGAEPPPEQVPLAAPPVSASPPPKPPAATPSPRPAAPKPPTNWNDLAVSLGLEPETAPEPPPQTRAFLEEIPLPGAAAEALDQPSANIESPPWPEFTTRREDPLADMFRAPPRSEHEPLTAAAEREADAELESGADVDADSDFGAAPERDRPPRRRGRRRGRRRSRGETSDREPSRHESPSRGDAPPEDEFRPFDVEDDFADEPAVEETRRDTEHTDQPQDESPPRRRRRRGRRRGRGRDADRSRAGSPAPAAERPSEPPADDEEDFDLLDATTQRDDLPPSDQADDDSGEVHAIGHRNIPTWAEAIGVIIDKNLEARARNPDAGGRHARHRGRGRRR